jgi:hypothetical protein
MTLKILTVFFSFIGYFVLETKDEIIIKQKLQNQAVCWNNGDIQCFMADYWKSDQLLYIGKSGVTYGWKNILNNYKKNYPSKKEMGELHFEVVELKKLDQNHYFMVGKWQLKREIEDLSGHFTLIWEKIDGHWVIVADHSS